MQTRYERRVCGWTAETEVQQTHTWNVTVEEVLALLRQSPKDKILVIRALRERHHLTVNGQGYCLGLMDAKEIVEAAQGILAQEAALEAATHPRT